MSKLLDCSLVVSKFEFISLLTSLSEKYPRESNENTLIPQAVGSIVLQLFICKDIFRMRYSTKAGMP